jgi:isoleucyl-tRNA synthetase
MRKPKKFRRRNGPRLTAGSSPCCNSLVKDVKEQYEHYEPTRAARLIQDFVTGKPEQLVCAPEPEKRYWGGEFDTDKRAAYQTLYSCLETVALLAAPMAPFYMDKLFNDLNGVTGRFRMNRCTWRIPSPSR